MPSTHLVTDQVPAGRDQPSSHPADHQRMQVGVEHAGHVLASPLVRCSTREVADAVLATRVGRQGGACLGTLPVGDPTTRAIVARSVAI